MNKITYCFLREKPVMIMLYLIDPSESKKTISFISKKTDLTYSHAIKIIKLLEKNELISSQLTGRNRELTLTKKGYIFAQELKNVYSKLEGLEVKK